MKPDALAHPRGTAAKGDVLGVARTQRSREETTAD
jgi:hypothetical protein